MSGVVVISYSRTDRAYVDELAAFLEAEGIRVWFDDHLGAGELFAHSIAENIAQCAVLIVVLTPDAVSSEWVDIAVSCAVARHKEIMPLLLAPCDTDSIIPGKRWEDVTYGGMPSGEYLSRLKTLTGPDSGRQPADNIPSDTCDDVLELGDHEYVAIPEPSVLPVMGDPPPEAVWPSPILRQYMFSNEKLRGEWRHHLMSLAPTAVDFVLTTLTLGFGVGYAVNNDAAGFAVALALVWLAVVAWVLWRVAEWSFTRLVLTNKRLMTVEGVFKRNVRTFFLGRITDIRLIQSTLGRRLDYGTFKIGVREEYGEIVITIRNVPYPNVLYAEIVDEMYEPEVSEAWWESRRTLTGY